jgi:hypothetical protein
LIDTILKDRPIPLFFFQRTTHPQTGRPAYAVVDGQQRVRAILDFLQNKVRLPGTTRGRRFSDLSPRERESVLNYDLLVVELSGYSDAAVRDVFIRMNKYVVKLSPQELRHAREESAFARFVEEVASWPIWLDEGIFSKTASSRMRDVEFAAELTILLVEGPQDKKKTIDLYYEAYSDSFEEGEEAAKRLRRYLNWVTRALPDLRQTRFRRPVELYGLIGALDALDNEGLLEHLDPTEVTERLLSIEERLGSDHPDREASRYLVAASRQTDNLTPRTTRIDFLHGLLLGK